MARLSAALINTTTLVITQRTGVLTGGSCRMGRARLKLKIQAILSQGFDMRMKRLRDTKNEQK